MGRLTNDTDGDVWLSDDAEETFESVPTVRTSAEYDASSALTQKTTPKSKILKESKHVPVSNSSRKPNSRGKSHRNHARNGSNTVQRRPNPPASGEEVLVRTKAPPGATQTKKENDDKSISENIIGSSSYLQECSKSYREIPDPTKPQADGRVHGGLIRLPKNISLSVDHPKLSPNVHVPKTQGDKPVVVVRPSVVSQSSSDKFMNQPSISRRSRTSGSSSIPCTSSMITSHPSQGVQAPWPSFLSGTNNPIKLPSGMNIEALNNSDTFLMFYNYFQQHAMHGTTDQGYVPNPQTLLSNSVLTNPSAAMTHTIDTAISK
ncbi:unnamed protein product, partial [Protopolystoma xenopodis]